MERVRELPAVERVAITSRGAMRGTGFKSTTVLPGQPVDPNDLMNTSGNAVSVNYFSVMGMRFVAGRNYTAVEPMAALGQGPTWREEPRLTTREIDP